ncbi:MAG TPA: PspC domain-containing protein [Streptosporangiaceae bacterium]
MDTNTVTEEPIQTAEEPIPNDFEPTEPDPIAASASDAPPRESRQSSHRPPLRRPLSGRILTGVAQGVADYLDIDVTIVRVAFCVLAVIGGAGIPLYVAGLLLIPDQGSDQSIVSSLLESLQSRSR